MIQNYPYLNDSSFLDKIFNLKTTVIYVKTILLNWNEMPIDQIQGKITSGSITFDGKSNVRRTANLTIALDGYNDYKQVNLLFSINKKVSIEIGIKNTTGLYTDFPICWFPMGLYIIINSSVNHSSTELTLNLQLKDKMCLLNGECGGTIHSATVFDTYETIDPEGNPIITRPTIYRIIMQLVNHFGGEDLGKIIIADLETLVKQVMKWTGSAPLYILYKMNGSKKQYYITISERDRQAHIADGWSQEEGSPFAYGYDVGYTYTDFTYPGQLVCEPGAAVTDVLDKIIGVLGNYEYFYDVNGNFVFQEIKNYLNNSQSKYIIEELIDGNTDSYLLDMSNGKTVYDFQDSTLITSFSNNPQYSKIRNDFVIWGIRQTAAGINIPIRYHLAIDKKPTPGNTYYAFKYIDPQDDIQKWHLPIKFESKSHFPETGAYGVFYYDTSTQKIYKWGRDDDSNDYLQINATIQSITTTDWRTELYFQGVLAEPFGIESNYYFQELVNEWPKIYDIENGTFREETSLYPESIDYFLDFIDSDSQIGQFSVENIGRRSLVENKNEDVNCVFEPNIPDLILINAVEVDRMGMTMREMRQYCQARGQEYSQVSDTVYEALEVGGTLNSAYNYVRQMLHQATSYNQNVSISCIPIYTLQPNTRIGIHDTDSGINGDYLINNITISFGAGDTMSVSATRALEKI